MADKTQNPVRATWGTCTVCESLHGGIWILQGSRKRQVWNMTVPATGDAADFFDVLKTARLCREHVEVTCGYDPEFRKRHASKELLPPLWWRVPAREAQVRFLHQMISERHAPAEIKRHVTQNRDKLERGQVCKWIETLKYCDKRAAPKKRNAENDTKMNETEAFKVAERIRNGIQEMHDLLGNRNLPGRATMATGHICQLSRIVMRRITGVGPGQDKPKSGGVAALFQSVDIEGEKLAELLLYYIGAITDVGERGAPKDGLPTDDNGREQ